MGGEDELDVGIHLCDDAYQFLLPIDMQAHLRFVHKEDVWLLVFKKNSKEYEHHLLLTGGQLPRCQDVALLQKTYAVGISQNNLLRLPKEFIDMVVEELYATLSLTLPKGEGILIGHEFFFQLIEQRIGLNSEFLNDITTEFRSIFRKECQMNAV